MKKADCRWADIRPGDFVADKNGTWWKVERWDHVQASIVDKDGKTARVRPSPYSKVHALQRTGADAVKVVEKILGGTVIERRKRS